LIARDFLPSALFYFSWSDSWQVDAYACAAKGLVGDETPNHLPSARRGNERAWPFLLVHDLSVT